MAMSFEGKPRQMNTMVDLVREIYANFVEFWSISELPPTSPRNGS
jgi:hypothetical protein